jgi:ankyrin repeat protein
MIKFLKKLAHKYRKNYWERFHRELKEEEARKIAEDKTYNLFQFIREGSLEGVKKEITKNRSIINKEGGLLSLTPVNYAYFLYRTEIAIYLIEQGADINIKNYRGETLLMIASSIRDEKMINILTQDRSSLSSKKIK